MVARRPAVVAVRRERRLWRAVAGRWCGPLRAEYLDAVADAGRRRAQSAQSAQPAPGRP